MNQQKLLPGNPRSLGATAVMTPSGAATNFALWAPHAQRVELCLFEGDSETRLTLSAFDNGVWHGQLNSFLAGQRYGYRVHGAWDPPNGLRFNPNKLLIDPYARALDSHFQPDPRWFDYEPGTDDWQMDTRDSATTVPKSIVYENRFDWQSVPRPRTPLRESVIYELHVRGFTMQHPLVPPQLRGTFLGMAQPAVIAYLQQLGVTAIELLPCATFVTEPHLADQGLSNYWGYNPIAFFAPHRGYALHDPVAEFQTMVRAMHRAGIEVLVDVVYNHTAEAATRGPTLSYRGIDNEGYYWLRPHDRGGYVNNSGCGNSLACDHPIVLRLVMDSLRYWVETLGVDGFRFDLAPSMARVRGEFDRQAPFLQAVFQDPVLAGVKLIAEPWDVGHAGYRLGQFPDGWSEWNDQYRKTMRSFWRGDPVPIGDVAARLSGSSDLFDGRGPEASINYIAAHDGFTLHDLVSYEQRHNEENKENNNDGERDNRSWNHGIEGPSDDPQVQEKRLRDRRNLLTTLFLSQGVPMLQAGDELGRTQHGNNNAYCQDNRLSWIDWKSADTGLVSFVRKLIRLRRGNGVFHRREFLVGSSHEQEGQYDVLWLAEDGQPMQIADWHDPDRSVLAMLLRGKQTGDSDGTDTLILVNGSSEAVQFRLPPPPQGGDWVVLLDTVHRRQTPSGIYSCAPRSLALLAGME